MIGSLGNYLPGKRDMTVFMLIRHISVSEKGDTNIFLNMIIRNGIRVY